MSTYPEHEKLTKVAETSQEIGTFVEEFLHSKGIVLASYEEGRLHPISTSITTLLAEHFDIDLDKIEAEKRQMLDEIRSKV